MVFCPEPEIASPTPRRCFMPMAAPYLDVRQAKNGTDFPLPTPNKTGMTGDITRLALQALVGFQLGEQRKVHSLDNNVDRDLDGGVEAAKGEYFDDQGGEDQGEDQTEDQTGDDEDGYRRSDKTGEKEGGRGTDCVQGPFVTSVDNKHFDKVGGTYFDARNDYGVARPEDPNDDWSSSDYYSDCSEDQDSESGSQDYYEEGDTQKRSWRRSLFTQYRLVLPPNSLNCDPPAQFPTEPIYYPVALHIPQGIYAFVKDVAVDSSLCQLVMARSMMKRINDYGLKKGGLCCIKIYSKNHNTAERARNSKIHLKTEIKAYQRLAEAARRDKPGFLFLMQLDASLQDDSRYYLIMPLMKTDLRTILQIRGLPIDNCARELETRRLLAQMAVGIATLHSMGIIHRDIKPENILIDFYGNIQIADFGISMVADSCEPCLNGKKYCWERVGTWPYAAPEVTVDEKPLYGLEIDYWALGCIAFEMEAWGHQDLFMDNAEYDHWCSIGGGSAQERLKFLAFAKLSRCAFVLVCGLLHPDPKKRYGILALLKHPYFMQQGISEFHCLGERAVRRPREPFIPSVVPHRPKKYAPRAADNTAHGWINPRGGFFP